MRPLCLPPYRFPEPLLPPSAPTYCGPLVASGRDLASSPELFNNPNPLREERPAQQAV